MNQINTFNYSDKFEHLNNNVNNNVNNTDNNNDNNNVNNNVNNLNHDKNETNDLKRKRDQSNLNGFLEE